MGGQDIRTALPIGHELGLGSNVYTIEYVIGYGGSCIVYNAKKEARDKNALGLFSRSQIIKEFYPLSVEGIVRTDNLLNIPEACRADFEELKAQFLRGAHLFEEFYEMDANHALARPFILGEAGGTAYAVSDPSFGSTLKDADRKSYSLYQISELIFSLCEVAGKYHEKGLLYLDFKPDNIFEREIDGHKHIALFDFDTVISVADIKERNYKYSTYSDGWAPPEQKNWQPGKIGPATDIFSLGAVFFWLLTGEKPILGKRPNGMPSDIEALNSGKFNLKKTSSVCENASGFAVTQILEILCATLQVSPDSRENLGSIMERLDTLRGETFDDKQPEGMYVSSLIREEGEMTRQMQAEMMTMMRKILKQSDIKAQDDKEQYEPFDGSVYEGGMKNGKRHGQGKCTWPDGSSYVGEWADDVRTGNGKFSYITKDTYDGDWDNNKRKGYGIYTWKNGDVYSGYWDGERNGQGKMTWPSGEWYEGNYEKGQRNGKGRYYADGHIYDGEWKDGRYCGIGKIKWPNEAWYEGNFKDGLRNGKGTYYADDCVYDGEWKDDKCCGLGKKTWPSGEWYEGEWENGLYNGKGTYHYADDHEYDGEWKDDKRCGFGKMKWPSGDWYEGNYENGRRNGKGTYHYADDHEYDGEWKDGKYCGLGKMTWPSGAWYEGNYENGRRNGKGIYHYADDHEYDGEWKDDKRCGLGKFIWPDEAWYEGNFENGLRNGKGIYHYADGHIYDGEWKDGRYCGIGKMKWPSGAWYEGEWENNLRNGKGTYHYADGTTIEGMWINDKYADES